MHQAANILVELLVTTSLSTETLAALGSLGVQIGDTITVLATGATFLTRALPLPATAKLLSASPSLLADFASAEPSEHPQQSDSPPLLRVMQ